MYQPVALPQLGLLNANFSYSNNLSVYQKDTGLFLTAVDTGIAWLKAWQKEGDTQVAITLHITSDSLLLAARADPRLGATGPKDSLQASLNYYRLLNEPFPQGFNLPAVAEKDTFSNALLNGKITVIECWYYGCPACKVQAKSMAAVYPEFRGDSSVQFLSFFRDSAYVADGKTHFYSERHRLKLIGENEKVVTWETMDFPARHFYNLKACEHLIPSPGYPRTFIIDKKGIIRSIFYGGSKTIGEDIERQVRLYQGFVPGD